MFSNQHLDKLFELLIKIIFVFRWVYLVRDLVFFCMLTCSYLPLGEFFKILIKNNK